MKPPLTVVDGSAGAEPDPLLADLLDRAPRYSDVFVVPFSRDESGGFQARGRGPLAVIHDADLLNLLDYLWKCADARR